MIVCLEVTSFRGLCIGATHYYGSLKPRRAGGEHQRIRLEHPLSDYEAREANRVDGVPDGYQEGEMSERFSSEDAVISRAEQVCAFLFDEDEVVVVMCDDFNPHRVIMCPNLDDMRKLNQLAAAADTIGWYASPRDSDAEWRNPIMDVIAATYEDTIKAYR